jgi:hypothetical protein
VRRIVVIALSVILALVVAIPMASGKDDPNEHEKKLSPPGQLKKNLPDLTGEWWNWALQKPSPLVGSYNKNSPKCEGEYVEGVFFLAGSAFDPKVPSVERNCLVPARMPILFPVVNVICSKAFTGHQPKPDPKPYDKKCAEPITDDVIDPPSKFFATLDGKDLKQQRIASGIFQWTIESKKNPFGLDPGTYPAASDGLWVFLKHGLKPGKHTIKFGGTFKDTPFGNFEGTHVTYHLKAVKKADR